MFVNKFKNGNINVKFESGFDRRENNRREGLTDLDEFAIILCDSIELDFSTDGEHHIEGMYLQNYSNGKHYLINSKDAEDFFKGKSVKLFPGETCVL